MGCLRKNDHFLGSFHGVHYKSSLGSKKDFDDKYKYYHIIRHSKETPKTLELKWFSRICAGSDQNKCAKKMSHLWFELTTIQSHTNINCRKLNHYTTKHLITSLSNFRLIRTLLRNLGIFQRWPHQSFLGSWFFFLPHIFKTTTPEKMSRVISPRQIFLGSGSWFFLGHFQPTKFFRGQLISEIFCVVENFSWVPQETFMRSFPIVNSNKKFDMKTIVNWIRNSYVPSPIVLWHTQFLVR